MKPGFTRALSARGLLVTAVTTAVLAGGGAAAYAAASHDDDGGGAGGVSSAPVGDRENDDAGGTAPRITAAQAAAAALKAAPGLVGELELDDGDDDDGAAAGRMVWEADVLAANGTWRELTIDAGSGKVLGNQAAGRDDDGDDRDDDGDDRGDDDGRAEAASLKNAKVTAAQAAAIALKKAPGTVTSVDFDRYWEVDVVKNGVERELKIDPASGSVRADVVDDD